MTAAASRANDPIDEVIDYPGGRYVVSSEPSVEVVLRPAPGHPVLAAAEIEAVVAVGTHDPDRVADLVAAVWPGGPLPRPERCWLRAVPGDPALRTAWAIGVTDQRRPVGHMWWPARPGEYQATPAVTWPVPAVAERNDRR